IAQAMQCGMTPGKMTKRDLSPVTVADFAIQAFAGKRFEEAMPRAILVGEESAGELMTEDGAPTLEAITRFLQDPAPGATAEQVCAWINRGNASPADRFWTLDPIDGTKGYLRGGQFAIAL